MGFVGNDNCLFEVGGLNMLFKGGVEGTKRHYSDGISSVVFIPSGSFISRPANQSHEKDNDES